MNVLQDRLIKELEDLIAHLNQYEEKNWASIFTGIKKLIAQGDRRGVDSLKNMRGGMGGFTDLIICQVNGHKIEKNQKPFANTELMRLGDLVFSTAEKLNRELNKKSV